MSFNSFVYDLSEDLPNNPITAACCVHFRPDANWNGEGYGFDWMRLGDTKTFGDTQPYRDIVAKQYSKSTGKLELDINAYTGTFKTDSELYAALERYYNPIYVCWKRATPLFKGFYYCPWLSLYPKTPEIGPVDGNINTTAKLRLYLDIGEAPDRLEFGDNPNFEISPKIISSDLKKGTYFWSGGDTISITCREAFNSTQTIDVFAVTKNTFTGADERRLAGRLLVWKNAYNQKRQKVLLVQVKTPAIGSNVSNIGDITGQSQLFTALLAQALISANVSERILDVSNDKDNNGKLIFGPGGCYKYQGNKIISYYKNNNASKLNQFKDLKDYLIDKLIAQDSSIDYTNYLIAFYFAEYGGCIDEYNKYHDLKGYAQGNVAVMFVSKNNATAAHELLHVLGLPHSFTNKEADHNAINTYTSKMTENIMDYSCFDNNLQYSLWKWQWEIANRNAKKYL